MISCKHRSLISAYSVDFLIHGDSNYCNVIMERSIYNCINTADTADDLREDKLRKLPSSMIENQLLEHSDNFDMTKGKDTLGESKCSPRNI